MAIQLGATSRGSRAAALCSPCPGQGRKLLQPPAGDEDRLGAGPLAWRPKSALSMARAPDASLAYWRDGDNVHHAPKEAIIGIRLSGDSDQGPGFAVQDALCIFAYNDTAKFLPGRAMELKYRRSLALKLSGEALAGRKQDRH